MRHFLALALILFPSPTLAQTSTILSGEALLTRSGRDYRVVRGTKLYEGDRLRAGFVQIEGDYGAWTGTLRGQLLLTKQRRLGCGIENILTYTGPFSIFARPFTCRTSRVYVVSFSSGTSYRIGSSAQFRDEGTTTIATVSTGAVVAESAGQEVTVPAGYGNITQQGQPPGQPIPIDHALALKNIQVQRLPWGVKISGKVNPLNQVTVQGVTVPVNAAGCFSTALRLPISSNRIEVVVKGAGERQRLYARPASGRRF